MVLNKLGISKEYHIQPSEIDKMQFWEYEIILHEIDAEQKEAAKRNKEEQEKLEGMREGMKPPKMTMPKVSIPKMNFNSLR